VKCAPRMGVILVCYVLSVNVSPSSAVTGRAGGGHPGQRLAAVPKATRHLAELRETYLCTCRSAKCPDWRSRSRSSREPAGVS
jgi:hypothetical protein